MRISDWSSDVGSSDLRLADVGDGALAEPHHRAGDPRAEAAGRGILLRDAHGLRSEERRVGNECVIRVDLGGRRIIQNTITLKCYNNHYKITIRKYSDTCQMIRT